MVHSTREQNNGDWKEGLRGASRGTGRQRVRAQMPRAQMLGGSGGVDVLEAGGSSFFSVSICSVKREGSPESEGGEAVQEAGGEK